MSSTMNRAAQDMLLRKRSPTRGLKAETGRGRFKKKRVVTSDLTRKICRLAECDWRKKRDYNTHPWKGLRLPVQAADMEIRRP